MERSPFTCSTSASSAAVNFCRADSCSMCGPRRSPGDATKVLLDGGGRITARGEEVQVSRIPPPRLSAGGPPSLVLHHPGYRRRLSATRIRDEVLLRGCPAKQ